MKRFILIFVLAFTTSMVVFANDSIKVVRNGNTFEQVVSQKKSTEPTKTDYTYKDKSGNVYPIYLSASGKAFIMRTSKKTGKEYRQYLPEVGKQINPTAYINDKK